MSERVVKRSKAIGVCIICLGVGVAIGSTAPHILAAMAVAAMLSAYGVGILTGIRTEENDDA